MRKKFGKRDYGDSVDYVLKNAPCEVVVIRGAMSDSLLQDLELEIE